MSSARLALTSTLVLTSLAGLLSLGGCAEEDTRLFDETGVWSLEQYTLAGTGFENIDQVRKNHYLLRFSPDDKVVAAANCYTQGSSNSNVNDSSCELNKALAVWDCHCYAYVYDNSRMVWQEFAPGENPPKVASPTPDGSTGSHELFVETTDSKNTYEFVSLPEGLFNSDGSTSRHIFQQKADTLWEVDINEDGTLDLDQCSMDCFPSMR
ncbi:MAG: hypothetical protein KC457_25480 [Myxococcales bacterium]|nr:hypothetical protein [Myxococcales bacterium]